MKHYVPRKHPRKRPQIRIRVAIQDGKRTDTFQRIFFGSETRCQYCGAIKGEIHADCCQLEECPKCHGALASCNCVAIMN